MTTNWREKEKRTPEGWARRKVQRAAYQRRYRERLKKANPEKYRAQREHVKRGRTPEQKRAAEAVRRAIFSGVLVRPGACEQCFKECKPDAAHYNYEDRLRVRWLCRPCHYRWDKEVPKHGYDKTGQSRSRAGVFNGCKTHCKYGHEFTPENTYYYTSPKGTARRCAACHRRRAAERKARLKMVSTAPLGGSE